MKILTIDKTAFLKGMSHSVNTSSGFSPESVGIEVDRRGDLLGLLYPGRNPIESSANIADNIMASFLYYRNSALYYYSIGDAGKIYETNVITKAHTVKDTDSKIYDKNSSILVFNGRLKIASQTDIYDDDFAFTVKDNDWWTNTLGKTALTAGVPHKLFDYHGVMMITNGNKIASWDNTTANEAALTLPEGWIITDCLVDGLNIYISASLSKADYAMNTETRIFVWNGVSTDYQREVVLDIPVITAMVKAENGYILFSGRNMFIFDGYSYVWLRYIDQSPTFNQVKAIDGKIYFATFGAIACYNTRLKIFTKPVSYGDVNNIITCLNIGYFDYIDFWSAVSTSAVGKFFRCTSNNSLSVFFSDIYSVGNIYIRNIEILFSQPLPTNASYTLKVLDETSTSIKEITFNETGKMKLPKSAGDLLVSNFQIYLSFDNTSCVPVQEIRIYYDTADNITTK